MEKEIKSNAINLTLLDYGLLFTANIFFFIILNRNEKYIWILFVIIPLVYLAYRKPQFLLAVTVQLTGIIQFFMDRMDYTAVQRAFILFSLVFSVLFLLRGLNRSLLSYLKEPLVIMIAIFSLLWWMSISHTPTPRYGTHKVAMHILFNIPLVLQFVLFKLNFKDYETFFKFIVLFTFLIALSSLFHILTFGIPRNTNLNFFEINTIWMARLYAIGIIASSFSWYEALKYKKILYLSMGILFLLLMLVLGKRGPLLSLFIILLMIILFRNQKLFKKDHYVLAPLIGIILIIGIYWQRLIEFVSGLFGTSQISLLFRVQMLQLFTKVLKSASLLGFGAGGFSKLSIGQDIRWYPHNFFVETLLEAGIIAAIILILIILIQIRDFLILRRTFISDSSYINLLIHSTAIFIFGILNSFFSGDLYTNRYIWIGLGLYLGVSLMKKQQIEET